MAWHPCAHMRSVIARSQVLMSRLAHPHMCGENTQVIEQSLDLDGTPPHVWGACWRISEAIGRLLCRSLSLHAQRRQASVCAVRWPWVAGRCGFARPPSKPQLLQDKYPPREQAGVRGRPPRKQRTLERIYGNHPFGQPAGRLMSG